MNALQSKYSNQPFTVLATPCAQFLNQEPATKNEILIGMEFVRPGKGFRPTFPMTNKLEVNGDNTHPMYKFLRGACPSPQASFEKKQALIYDPMDSSDIRWNFEKFLIGRDGRPIKRYHSTVTPMEMVDDIEKALKN